MNSFITEYLKANLISFLIYFHSVSYLLIPKAISHVEGSTGRIIIAGIPAEVDLQEGIKDLCRKYCIEFGVLVSAIGSLKKVNFDEGKIKYEKPVALISSQGYFTRTNSEEVFSHIHCNTRAPAFASAEDQILIFCSVFREDFNVFAVLSYRDDKRKLSKPCSC